MKINVTNILLGALIGLLIWQNFSPSKKADPVEVVVTIPEHTGTTGNTVIKEIIKEPVYIPQTQETFEVDSEWKKRYESAIDSLEKTKLYLEAIKINKYEKILIDNDTIQIKGFATSRGDLLDYKVDYTIKGFDITYTPKVVKKRPRLSVGFGVQSGIPTQPETDFLLKGNLNFVNKKGNGLTIGWDTENRFWFGVNKNITILK